jgi:Holliday junction resolvase
MTQYERGASFERTVKADLESHDYLVKRVAGSRGAVDLIAYNVLEPWFIQVKINGKMGPEERHALHVECVKVGAVPVCAYRPKRGKIAYKRLLSWFNGLWEEIEP